MVAAAPHTRDDSTANGPTNNDDVERTIRGRRIRSRSPPTSDEERRNGTPPRRSAYENWSCDDDDDDDDNVRSIADDAKKSNDGGSGDPGALDDVAWTIISVVLKGWCAIWVLFAVLVVASELMTPQHSEARKRKNVAKNNNNVVDDQLLLETSERISSACSYSRLRNEEGRGACQELCRDHMCCFDDDDDRYGCVDDPERACAAHAGCESLVLSEKDAIAQSAVTVWSPKQQQQQQQSASSGEASSAAAAPDASFEPSSELQLVRQVVSSVCSDKNLRTRQAILECASLCNPSMCCFNRTEIELLNPKMDLILKMEGIGNDVLDRTEMGTCANETEDGATTTTTTTTMTTTMTNHFCEVHAGCKNVLLFGAPAISEKKSRPSSSSNGDSLIFTKFGVYDKDHQKFTPHGAGAAGGERRSLATVIVSFVLMIGLTAYLLVWNRVASPAALERVWRNSRRVDDSSEDFAPVNEMVDFL